MKEKRYFCDYWFASKPSDKLPFLIIVLSLLLITFSSGIINYNLFWSKNGNALNSYYESAYTYLDEIADNVIQEGEGIDLLALPDDVVKYEITSENNEVIFKYYLDNNKDMEFAVSLDMTVELTNDFYVVSKEHNYSSEEACITKTKSDIISLSISYGVLIWIGFFILGFITCTVIACISQANKNKSLS